MLRLVAIISILLTPAVFAANENCPAKSLPTLKNANADPEQRAHAGLCLIGGALDQSEVARTVLQIIRDPKEDLFLREDLIDALAANPIRRTVKVEGSLGPKLGEEEKNAVDRTVASANTLLALTQAVKAMDEVVVVTRSENDFFRALSEIAQEEANHVLLRASAVNALEKLSAKAVQSGLYEEKMIRMTQETLRVIAQRDDSASHFSGAVYAYNRLADAGVPGYIAMTKPVVVPTRALASEKAQ